MNGNAAVRPAYPATLIDTNKNSPGASCRNRIPLAGTSRRRTRGFTNKRLKPAAKTTTTTTKKKKMTRKQWELEDAMDTRPKIEKYIGIIL